MSIVIQQRFRFVSDKAVNLGTLKRALTKLENKNHLILFLRGRVHQRKSTPQQEPWYSGSMVDSAKGTRLLPRNTLRQVIAPCTGYGEVNTACQ